MHGVLNIDEIKKLIAQFGCTLRDERFEPNYSLRPVDCATMGNVPFKLCQL
jgi:hypothetical protein